MIFDPELKKYYLCGDMHIHTNYSDGAALEKVLVSAVNHGLDFIAVTDHDNFEGSKAAQKLVSEMNLPLIVIPGIEITGPGAHILAYCISADPHAAGIPIKDACRRIRESGGLAVMAHPNWDVTRKNIWENHLFHEIMEEDLADAFELSNGDPETCVANGNMAVIEYYHEALKRGKHFAVTAGSDAHSAERVGCPMLVVMSDTPDAAGICRAIFQQKHALVYSNGKTYGACDLTQLPKLPLRLFSSRKSPESERFRRLPLRVATSNYRSGLFCDPDKNSPAVLLSDASDFPFSENFLSPRFPEEAVSAKSFFDPEKGLHFRLHTGKNAGTLFLSPDVTANNLSEDEIELNLKNALLPYSSLAGVQYGKDHFSRLYAAELHADSPLAIELLPVFAENKLKLLLREKNLFQNGLPTHTISINGVSLPVLPSLSPGETHESIIPALELPSDGRMNLFRILAQTENGINLFSGEIKFPVLECPENDYSLPCPLSDIVLNMPRPDGLDAKAAFRASWDQKALTVELSVEKETFCQPYHGMSVYMGDAFQLGIDPAMARPKFNLIAQSVWELLLAETNTGNEIFILGSPGGSSYPGQKAASQFPVMLKSSNPKQRVFTISFPWDVLGCTPGKGKRIGFNAIFNVNDGEGRRGAHQWTRGIFDRKCAFDWGILILK